MSALKFGDAYSIAKRNEARSKAAALITFPMRDIDKLIDAFEDVLAECTSGFAILDEDRKALREEVLSWLRKHYDW